MAGKRLVKAGLLVLAPGSGAVQHALALPYNPETLTRSFEVHGEGRAATETLQFVAEFDATDGLEQPEAHAAVLAHGIAPELAVLESLVQPARAPEAPLVLFTWGVHRVVPVRVTQLSIAEEAFDAALNPLRARVSLGLRVLTTDDFSPTHRGTAVYHAYLRGREALATRAPGATMASLGLRGLP